MMRQTTGFFISFMMVWLAALPLLALPARAQTAPPVLPPVLPSAEISVGDSVTAVAEGSINYVIPVEAGQTIQLDLISDEFDPLLTLFGAAGGEIARDDDSGGSFNSRIVYRVERTGSLTANVGAFAGEPQGRYTLRVTETVTDAIAVGDTVRADVRVGPTVYTIDLDAGEVVRVTLDSPDFDTALSITDGQNFEVVGDDGQGAGNRSVVTVPPQRAGAYRIIVYSVNDDPSGLFTLRVAAAEPQPIDAATRLSGTTEQALYYSLPLTAGECTVFQFVATDAAFDPYLYGFGPDGLLAFSDDDGGERLNAYLNYCAAETGIYRVLAGAFYTDPVGAYLFEAQRSTPATLYDYTPDGVVELPAGPINRSIGQSSDQYQIALQAGQAVRISLTSDFFDAFLTLTQADMASEISSDDDGGDGSNALLTYTAPLAGTYGILVSGFGCADVCDYTLDVQSVPPILGAGK